jgi:V/A-type H+-transporting ATPase subunit I
MPWRDRLIPARMCRAAIVAPQSRWRAVLVHTADAGVFQPDEPAGETGRELGPASLLVGKLRPSGVTACLAHDPVEPDRLDKDHDLDLLLGEASLEKRLAATTSTERSGALLGWIPSRQAEPLRSRIEPFGGSLVELPTIAGSTPPSLLAPFAGKAGRVLVDTYATVPYRDVDPTAFAAIAYVVMFGMMFGDVGHGAIVAALGLAARFVDRRWTRATRRVWAIIFGSGVASMVFGLLYGEAFGPTGLVPVVWLEPLEEPDRLLVAGVVVGAVLLAVTYVLASIDRWREGGMSHALYASTGLAGALVFAGVAALAGGVAVDEALVWRSGVAVAGIGLLLTVVGLIAEVGFSATALLQVFIEVFDVVLRLGSNLVSFARLAAFGLTHAAISKVVWDATTASWGGAAGSVAAVVIFVVGNALAFTLEALVAGIQALRLEYYELFSRLFVSEGQAFRPWHVPIHVPLEDS